MELFRFRINKYYLWSQIVYWGYLPGGEIFLNELKGKYPKAWRWTKARAKKITNDKDSGIFIVQNLDEIKNCPQEVKDFFASAFRAKEFKKALTETRLSLMDMEKEWLKNKKKAIFYFTDITRLTLGNKVISVFMTHPALPNGRNYPSKDAIGWRYRLGFPNYNTIYLMHELLHLRTEGTFKRGSIMHAIVQLAIDNELRIRLNKKGRYFEIAGHSSLKTLEIKMFPFWKKYLKNKKENIIQFNQRIEKFSF